MDTMLALMLAVNILLLIALMAFAYKLNKDWAEFFAKVNMEWVAFAELLMGYFDADDAEEDSVNE
jgi:uncharacterized protein involved in cysteine biosynthesis